MENDHTGALKNRMLEVVDGQQQEFIYNGPAYFRENFFNTPELRAMVADLTDTELLKLKRGGHDPAKVYAAYKAAADHKGQPTVILAHTVKGYGIPGAEGTNTSHQAKKLVFKGAPNDEVKALASFRDGFNIPLTDEQLEGVPFWKPPADSPEMEYMHARRAALGGYQPSRNPHMTPCKATGTRERSLTITKRRSPARAARRPSPGSS